MEKRGGATTNSLSGTPSRTNFSTHLHAGWRLGPVGPCSRCFGCAALVFVVCTFAASSMKKKTTKKDAWSQTRAKRWHLQGGELSVAKPHHKKNRYPHPTIYPPAVHPTNIGLFFFMLDAANYKTKRRAAKTTSYKAPRGLAAIPRGGEGVEKFVRGGVPRRRFCPRLSPFLRSLPPVCGEPCLKVFKTKWPCGLFTFFGTLPCVLAAGTFPPFGLLGAPPVLRYRRRSR